MIAVDLLAPAWVTFVPDCRNEFGDLRNDGPFVVPVLFQGVVESMSQGTIKKLVSDRGFGFIEGERGELFFHHSDVQGAQFESLREGQAVTYTEGRGPKGPRAESVSLV